MHEFIFRNHLEDDKLWQPVRIGLESKLAGSPVTTKKIDLTESCGVELQFDLTGSVSREFALSSIMYLAQGESNAVEFRGALPCDLTFVDTDQSAQTKVGLPVRESGKTTDGSYFFHSWNLDKCILHVIFSGATSQLRRVICYLRMS